jgi:hypothetical protein
MSYGRAVGTYQGGYFQPRGGYVPRPVGRLGARSLDIVSLAPIAPAPVRDFRSLDFTRLINSATAGITEVSWDVSVMPDSPLPDPDPNSRLVADPTIHESGQASTVLFGDGIARVNYLLTATAVISDGRVLVRRGSLPCIEQELPEPEDLDPCVVPFDYEKWATLFPELAWGSAGACGGDVGGPGATPVVGPEQAAAYWRMAEELLRNDCTSPVCDHAEREEILMLLTAHIAALLGGPTGGGGFGPQITGTITSKSVNGVSLGGGTLQGVSGTQGWYQLTRYGQLAWMKLRAYRLFHYVPGPQRDLLSPFTSWPWKIGAWPGGWGWGWPGWQQPCKPPRPPQPPTEERILYVDRVSVVGDGLSAETALAVRIIEGGDYGYSEGQMARRRNGSGYAPQAIRFPVPPGRSGGNFVVWIDSASISGDGLTPATRLAVRTVAGDPGQFLPVAVTYPSWPPQFYVDGVSLIGDALTPATAFSVRIVAGKPNGS